MWSWRADETVSPDRGNVHHNQCDSSFTGQELISRDLEIENGTNMEVVARDAAFPVVDVFVHPFSVMQAG